MTCFLEICSYDLDDRELQLSFSFKVQELLCKPISLVGNSGQTAAASSQRVMPRARCYYRLVKLPILCNEHQFHDYDLIMRIMLLLLLLLYIYIY